MKYLIFIVKRLLLYIQTTSKFGIFQKSALQIFPIEVVIIQLDRSDAEGIKDGNTDAGKNQFLKLEVVWVYMTSSTILYRKPKYSYEVLKEEVVLN